MILKILTLIAMLLQCMGPQGLAAADDGYDTENLQLNTMIQILAKIEHLSGNFKELSQNVLNINLKAENLNLKLEIIENHFNEKFTKFENAAKNQSEVNKIEIKDFQNQLASKVEKLEIKIDEKFAKLEESQGHAREENEKSAQKLEKTLKILENKISKLQETLQDQNEYQLKNSENSLKELQKSLKESIENLVEKSNSNSTENQQNSVSSLQSSCESSLEALSKNITTTLRELLETEANHLDNKFEQISADFKVIFKNKSQNHEDELSLFNTSIESLRASFEVSNQKGFEQLQTALKYPNQFENLENNLTNQLKTNILSLKEIMEDVLKREKNKDNVGASKNIVDCMTEKNLNDSMRNLTTSLGKLLAVQLSTVEYLFSKTSKTLNSQHQDQNKVSIEEIKNLKNYLNDLSDNLLGSIGKNSSSVIAKLQQMIEDSKISNINQIKNIVENFAELKKDVPATLKKNLEEALEKYSKKLADNITKDSKNIENSLGLLQRNLSALNTIKPKIDSIDNNLKKQLTALEVNVMDQYKQLKDQLTSSEKKTNLTSDKCSQSFNKFDENLHNYSESNKKQLKTMNEASKTQLEAMDLKLSKEFAKQETHLQNEIQCTKNKFKNFEDSLKNMDKNLKPISPIKAKLDELSNNCQQKYTALQQLIQKQSTNLEKSLKTMHQSPTASAENNLKICQDLLDQTLRNQTASHAVEQGNLQNSLLDLQRLLLPKDCSHHNNFPCGNNKCQILNSIYDATTAFSVSCDQHTAGGGWTIIQRRLNGSLDFYRTWRDYKLGFGSIDGEFWIGLDKLHALTNARPMELYIKLRDFKNIEKYARYDLFAIGNELQHYELMNITDYSGNAGDCFSEHEGIKFSTMDRDNDEDLGQCAVQKQGAWWYHNCYSCNLNGKYFPDGKSDGSKGISWCKFHGFTYSLKFVEMMIRPKK